MDNDTRTVTDVRLGARGVESTTTGTLYFDDFESRRFSYIGTLPEPAAQARWQSRLYGYDGTQPHAVSDVTPDTGTPDT